METPPKFLLQKIQISLFTIPYRIIVILPVFSAVLLKFSSKFQLGELNGAVHLNLN